MLDRILKYIQKKGEFSVKDIANEFSISWNEARNYVRKLERNKVIEKKEGERGKYVYLNKKSKEQEFLKEKVLRYLEGEKVPQKLSHLVLILQIDKYKLLRILKKLKEEGKIKHLKGGYYIHADMVEYEVGSGKATIYKSPIMVHNLTLYYNCPKVQQLTVKPCRRSGQTTIDEIGEKCIETYLGGRVGRIEGEIFRNKRTKWIEVSTEADLGNMIIPIHIQMSEKDCKINLMTEASSKPMTIIDFTKFLGWLRAKFPAIDENQWYVKKYDIGDDWKFIGMDTGKFKEIRLTQFSNAVIHIYKKQIRGAGEVVRREIQYHTKEKELTPSGLIEIMQGISSGQQMKAGLQEEFSSVVGELKEQITRVVGAVEKEVEGIKNNASGILELKGEIEKLANITMQLTEYMQKMDEKLKVLHENDDVIAKGVAELLRELRKRKEEELKEVQELDKQISQMEKKDSDDYYYN